MLQLVNMRISSYNKLISERLLVITLLLVFQRLQIAEHLSARLLILQSVFLVGGMWPQLPSRFSNAIKGVACVQTSVLLRNAIKISCLQKFIALCCSGTCGLIVAITSKWKNCDVRRGKRLACNGSEDRVRKYSHNPVKSTSRTMSMRERT